MFIKKNKKARTRYSGVDNTPWKVVTYAGEELGRFETHKAEDGKTTVRRWVSRWSGFRGANAAARALGGVAVRA